MCQPLRAQLPSRRKQSRRASWSLLVVGVEQMISKSNCMQALVYAVHSLSRRLKGAFKHAQHTLK